MSAAQVPYFHRHTKLRIHGADGHHIYTDYGKLLDLNSGYWTVIAGHGHLSDAKVHETFWGDLFNFDHEPAENLCELLSELSGYSKVVLVCSGSSAVDVALRIALQVGKEHKRKDIVSLRRSYHGSSALCLACNGLLYGSPIADGGIRFHQLRPQYSLGSNASDNVGYPISEVDSIDWSQVAAFIFEPIQAVGGLRAVDESWLEKILKVARLHNVTTIADEVTTGLFRGPKFLYSSKLTPLIDMSVVGKPLTNGEFPLAAVLVSSKQWNRIESSHVPYRERYVWGETFGGHPKGAHEALKVLQWLTPAQIAVKEKLSADMHEMLVHEFGGHPAVRQIRTPSGFLAGGIVLHDQESYRDLEVALWSRGIRIGVEADAILFVPMFNMNLEQIELGLKALKSVLDAYC